MTSPASANSATWWSLMENSDTSGEELPVTPSRRHRRGSKGRGSTTPSYASPRDMISASRASSVKVSSSGRSSSTPKSLHQSPDKLKRGSADRHSLKLRKSLGTPRRSPHYRSPSQVSSVPSSLPSCDDEEDSEHKRIRWETPKTHHYQLSTEKPRALEEKFLNVLDSVQSNMQCSQHFERPVMNGSVWNLLVDPNRDAGQDSGSSKVCGSRTNDSNSQQFSDDQSADDSLFEDGPSVVEISAHPPIFSESITASESLLSTSQDSDDENNKNSVPNGSSGRQTSSSKDNRDGTSKRAPNPPAADSSQILDDLSGMESERNSMHSEKHIVEYDHITPLKPKQEHHPVGVGSGGMSHDARPSAKIYSTSDLFELEKEKSCVLSMGKLQGMNRSRSDALTMKLPQVSSQLEKLSLRKRMKGPFPNPPIADICVGGSNEISTMSASEDSYTYQQRNKVIDRLSRSSNNNNQERTAPMMAGGVNPEHKAFPVPVEPSNHILFDDSFQDETKSCIPTLLTRKRRGDAATTSSSSKSLGLRLLSRSGDAHTASEKENDVDNPYTYEYDSGVNTYVAYFENSKPNESRGALQVIEHPNPPLLPFGSNEVVVKIESSTISQADCSIRRGEWWGGTLSLPRIPGVAFSGKIDQIHKTGRNSMQRGDQVLSLVCSGSNSRYVCIPRERLVKVPPTQTQDSAKLACLPEIYLTAFQALHVGQGSGARYRNKSLSGKSIMFVGGVSALGQAIVELSVDAGASVVYATASKVRQFQRIIEMGGIPLSATPSEWLPSIHQQVDILIGSTDGLKDTDPLTYDHLNALKKKGQLVLLGGPGAADNYPVILPGKAPGQVDVFKILKKAHKQNVFESWERDMKQGKKDLTHLIGLLHKGALKPKILERVALSKVSKAEEIVESRRLHGVIVCEPWIKERQRSNPVET